MTTLSDIEKVVAPVHCTESIILLMGALLCGTEVQYRRGSNKWEDFEPENARHYSDILEYEFRLKPVEPREWWIPQPMDVACLATTKKIVGGIHVREVMEG